MFLEINLLSNQDLKLVTFFSEPTELLLDLLKDILIMFSPRALPAYWNLPRPTQHMWENLQLMQQRKKNLKGESKQ